VKILHVNKYLYRRGGAEAYMLDLRDLQQQNGDTVACFAMAHPENEPSEYSDFFPPRLELNPPPAGMMGRLRAAGRILYSPAARAGMAEVLDRFRPDVVHLHNIYHHLSPSILRPLVERSIPSVMTLHDYKLACPTYRFLAHGEPCTACSGARFHHAVLKRCNGGSLPASLLNAIESTVHSWSSAYAPVQHFIAPSQFLFDQMSKAGIFPERLVHLPHYVDPDLYPRKSAPGGGILYAGRLSFEKGVNVLIRAAAEAQLSLEIAGDGPDRQKLETLTSELGATRIRFHGHLAKKELGSWIEQSAVVALPSQWYENQPLVVLEAYACAVPVVGSALGGIPELVEDGVTGRLVPPGAWERWTEALRDLIQEPERCFAMGQQARRFAEERFSRERHLNSLYATYRSAQKRVA